MTCNAIATATARIFLTQGEAQLTAQTVQLLNTSNAYAQLLRAALQNMQQQPRSYSQANSKAYYACNDFDVAYERNGEIKVTSRTLADAQCKDIAKALAQFMAQGAAIILQEKVKAVVMQRAHVESAERSANGALVLKVDL